MKKSFHSVRAIREIFLVSFTAVALLTACGELRALYAQNASSRLHSVTINWNPSVSPVTGYNVYRAEPGGPLVKLTSKVVSGTRYVDAKVEAGKTYAYTIKAVDANGNESKPSTSITVTVPGPPTPPAKQ
jgi:fibronectin type 3 domain-containing protein